MVTEAVAGFFCESLPAHSDRYTSDPLLSEKSKNARPMEMKNLTAFFILAAFATDFVEQLLLLLAQRDLGK